MLTSILSLFSCKIDCSKKSGLEQKN